MRRTIAGAQDERPSEAVPMCEVQERATADDRLRRICDAWRAIPAIRLKSSITMPKHDLPDGDEAGNNLIDFRQHLRSRIGQSAQDNDEPGPKASKWDVYRHAEYGDGKRPRFGRHDAVWLGVLLAIGFMLWELVFR